MCRALGAFVLAILVLTGCGKRETDAERRQREAVDLCYKGLDRLKAKDEVGAETLFKRALEVDPLCEKACDALALLNAAVMAAKTQIGIFKAPLSMYQLDIGDFPSTKQGLQALRTRPADMPDDKKWNGPYLESEPPLDPWGQPYQYIYPGKHNPSSYDVWTAGPRGVIGNWTK